MEFTPSPSSIFQNKKIKYNNKKPTKNGIIWIKFSKISKSRCAHTLLSLRQTPHMQEAKLKSPNTHQGKSQNNFANKISCDIISRTFCPTPL